MANRDSDLKKCVAKEGDVVDGYTLMARQSKNGQCYSIWRAPAGRSYVLVHDYTDHEGKDLCKGQDLGALRKLFDAIVAPCVAGALTQEQHGYLKTLETCVDRAGSEFHDKGGDSRFWWERDVQGRLLAYLWDAGLTTQINVLGHSKQIPLVHAEFPARTGGNRHFDLALLEPREAVAVIEECFCSTAYSPLTALTRRILAAVEIKKTWFTDNALLAKVTTDVQRLVEHISNGQIDYGYHLVFCGSTFFPSPGKGRELCSISDLTKKRQSIESLPAGQGSERIRIYWASDHPDDKPGWC